MLLERSFLPGESPQDYRALLEAFCASLGVSDCPEFLVVQDMVDAVWEGLRLRRIRDARLTEKVGDVLLRLIAEALKPRFPQEADRRRWAQEIRDRWCTGVPQARTEVDQLLASLGHDETALLGRGFGADLDVQVKLDALAHGQGRRRLAAQAELQALRRLKADAAMRARPIEGELQHWSTERGSAPCAVPPTCVILEPRDVSGEAARSGEPRRSA
jgi:hypothetical protein